MLQAPSLAATFLSRSPALAGFVLSPGPDCNYNDPFINIVPGGTMTQKEREAYVERIREIEKMLLKLRTDMLLAPKAPQKSV